VDGVKYPEANPLPVASHHSPLVFHRRPRLKIRARGIWHLWMWSLAWATASVELDSQFRPFFAWLLMAPFLPAKLHSDCMCGYLYSWRPFLPTFCTSRTATSDGSLRAAR